MPKLNDMLDIESNLKSILNSKALIGVLYNDFLRPFLFLLDRFFFGLINKRLVVTQVSQDVL